VPRRRKRLAGLLGIVTLRGIRGRPSATVINEFSRMQRALLSRTAGTVLHGFGVQLRGRMQISEGGA
jgi:hypothetical protein